MRERAIDGHPVSDGVRGILIAGFRSQVAIDCDHDEDGPGDIAQRLERDSERGNGGLEPIGADKFAETAHEPRVVDFAGDFIVGFALRLSRPGLGSDLRSVWGSGRRDLLDFFFRHRMSESALPSLLYEGARDGGAAAPRGAAISDLSALIAFAAAALVAAIIDGFGCGLCTGIGRGP